MKRMLFSALLFLASNSADAAICKTPYGACIVPQSGPCACYLFDGSQVYGYAVSSAPPQADPRDIDGDYTSSDYSNSDDSWIGVILIIGLFVIAFIVIARMRSPKARRRRQLRVFENRMKHVGQRGEANIEKLSREAELKNIKELIHITKKELKLRQKDITPNVLEKTNAEMRSCQEKLDFHSIKRLYDVITTTSVNKLNDVLKNFGGGNGNVSRL